MLRLAGKQRFGYDVRVEHGGLWRAPAGGVEGQHQGRLEFGSPVVPCTREATLVHAIDELSGRMGAFDRLEQATPDGEAWSRFDRVLETSAYLIPVSPTPEARPLPCT